MSNQILADQLNSELHPQHQMDGPDDPVVNTEEQNEPVNPQEKDYEVDKKAGYSEGLRNDSDSDKKSEDKNLNPAMENKIF